MRKISPPPGFVPRTVHLVASRYTYYATRPTRITLTCSKTPNKPPNPNAGHLPKEVPSHSNFVINPNLEQASVKEKIKILKFFTYSVQRESLKDLFSLQRLPCCRETTSSRQCRRCNNIHRYAGMSLHHLGSRYKSTPQSGELSRIQ